MLEQKFNEVKDCLEQFQKCAVVVSNEQKKIFNVISTTGLTWKERSDKWGKLFIGTNRLRIDLDYPTNLFTEAELKKFTQLPLKEELTDKKNCSHINPTVGDTKHDVVRIMLYEDQLPQYNFSAPPFQAMLQKIVEHNVL